MTEQYQVTLKLQTVKNPDELVEVIKKLFHDDAFHIMGYDYHKVQEREISTEHHGGYQS